MATKYNGFSNKNTYLFDLYFKPKNIEDLYGLQFVLEEEKNNIKSNFIRNLVNLSSINYQELEEVILEENNN